MEEKKGTDRSVAAEMTFTWGPGKKYRSVRRISLEVVSTQAELISALQRESQERELRIQTTEMERDQNQDRIKELESEKSAYFKDLEPGAGDAEPTQAE